MSLDTSNCTETSVARTSIPSFGDVQITSTNKKEDDSDPIYLDFNFIAAQQNVDFNVQQQQFLYQNNNTFTSELLFNSIHGNINNQAEIKPNMVKPKRRGRPPNRKPLALPQPCHIDEYKIPIVSESTPMFEPPAPVPIIFETILVCPPKQTKLSLRQKMSNTNSVVTTPIFLRKLCRKQQLKLRPDDEYKIIVEILDISSPTASSPERTKEIVFDHKLTETPVRPSKLLFQQRRLLSMTNKSTVINSESSDDKDLNCITQATGQHNCENALEKGIRLKKERKTNGIVNINKKRKLVFDDKQAVAKKNVQYKDRDKENCENKDIGKRRKTSRHKTTKSIEF